MGRNFILKPLNLLGKFFNDQGEASKTPGGSPQKSNGTGTSSPVSGTSGRHSPHRRTRTADVAASEPVMNTESGLTRQNSSAFEHQLTGTERELLDDYELQLALALSLSSADEENRKSNLIDFD
jgi:hypothetical protein